MKVSKSLNFYCDNEEFSGVKKIADKVRADVKKVTGFLPPLCAELPSSEKNVVIFGTIGKSPLLDKLWTSGKIKLEDIKGKREVYGFFVFENQIIIAGSDKRGTIYGLFHFSELIGVSPLCNWTGAVPVHQDSIELTSEHNIISKEPSVKFRGFFINDEWPAFGNWSLKNFGGVNTACYENIFELLLRLKGNYLWPAMWASRFSDDGPGLANAELADELGVVMGCSHHEPCCRAGEEYKYLRGPGSIYGDAWNFRSNREGITKFWEDGLKRNGKLENVITVGMRGEADTAIMQNATLKDNIDLLRDVLATQNSLIKKYVNEDLTKVPRMLALYKEVEPYFYGDKKTKGLMDDPELEGVTLMLCDDNHGNLRTLPTEKMRSHNGGYGMYYHFDYHGWPYSYEWLNTSYLPKVKEQMTMAYDFGIQDLWIVNVGDIFSTEFPLSYFLDLAYDYEKYSDPEYTTTQYTIEWIERQFSTLTAPQKSDISFILNAYTKLTNLRRTEALKPLTFNPVNYSEADKTLILAQKVISLCEKLKKEIPESVSEIFFTQVYMPACGTMNVMKMQLLSGKNQWFASHGVAAANWYVPKIKECFEYDKALVAECDTIAKGKWYAEGWSEHFGFNLWCEAANSYPVYMTVEPCKKDRLCVWAEGSDIVTYGQDWERRPIIVDAFKNPNCSQAVVKAAPCCDRDVPFDVDGISSCEWLSVQVEKANNEFEPSSISNIIIKIDREKLAAAKDKKAKISLKGNDGYGARILVDIIIDAEVPAALIEQAYPGTFVQTTDYVSIEAGHFVASLETPDSAWQELPAYGKTLSGMKVFPVTQYFNPAKSVKNVPCLEYAFMLKEAGDYKFDFYANPTNPVAKDNKLQFAIEVNDKLQVIDTVGPDFAVGDNQFPWGIDIPNNIRISSAVATAKEGNNILKVYPVTPGFVLEKIVIYKNGTELRPSYLGPTETFCK